jgi:multiple sugar transport system permease protein
MSKKSEPYVTNTKRSVLPFSFKRTPIKRSELGPYLTIAPGIIFLALMAIYPFLFLLKISFQNYSPINLENEFIGFQNYMNLFSDHNFWNAIKVTLIYVISAVSIEFIIGIGLAIILNKQLKGKRIIQTLVLLPIIMAPTVVGLMFRFMFNERYGVINYFVEMLGFERNAWLSDPSLALPTLIATDIWQWTPFMIIILLAGLQGLPNDPIEAAEIDGASKWQIFRYVTVPMLAKVILIAVLLRTIDAFRIYDQIYMMTQGGPVNVTSTLSWLVYDKGFKFLDFGYGAAIAVTVLIIAVTAVLITLRKFDLFEESRENQ